MRPTAQSGVEMSRQDVASAGRVRCQAWPAPPPPAGSGRRGRRAGCPQLPGEPVGASALKQGLFTLTELAVGQRGCRAGGALAAQSVGSSGPPALVPQMHALARDAELASHLGLAD